MRISDWSSDVCSSDLKALLRALDQRLVDCAPAIFFGLVKIGGSGDHAVARIALVASLGFPELADLFREACEVGHPFLEHAHHAANFRGDRKSTRLNSSH